MSTTAGAPYIGEHLDEAEASFQVACVPCAGRRAAVVGKRAHAAAAPPLTTSLCMGAARWEAAYCVTCVGQCAASHLLGALACSMPPTTWVPSHAQCADSHLLGALARAQCGSFTGHGRRGQPLSVDSVRAAAVKGGSRSRPRGAEAGSARPRDLTRLACVRYTVYAPARGATVEAVAYSPRDGE